MPSPILPITLEGRHVRLEPMTLDHLPGLIDAGCIPALWDLTTSRHDTPATMRAYVETALAWRDAGSAIPFVTIARANGIVIGSTRFGNIAPEHRRAEIGWTWITPAWQRSAINTEAKYLMFRHAFEVWDLLRVELKTAVENARSRAAMARAGCTEEGTLRMHMIREDGGRRDSVYFSVIAPEWPRVRAHLEGLMAR